VRTPRMSNAGVVPLVVAVPASTGAVFSLDAVQTTVLPDEGVDLRVEFSPLAAGTVRRAIRVTSNAPGSPHTIGLSGSGRNEIPNQPRRLTRRGPALTSVRAQAVSATLR
jgi:hypothetical protein